MMRKARKRLIIKFFENDKSLVIVMPQYLIFILLCITYSVLSVVTESLWIKPVELTCLPVGRAAESQDVNNIIDSMGIVNENRYCKRS